MKILQEGFIAKQWYTGCTECSTKFTFTKEDIKVRNRPFGVPEPTPYVLCPLCNVTLDVYVPRYAY